MRDQLARNMETAREHLEPHWLNDPAVEDSLSRLHGRLRRRRRARIAVAGVVPVVLCVIVAGALGWFGPVPNWLRPDTLSSDPRMIATTVEQEPSGTASTIQFGDGSQATALTEESQLVATEVTSSNIRVRLNDGAARFSVTPRPERLFEVEAGDVSVLVLGTVFTVRHLGDRIEVEVERGLVRVAWQGGARAIPAGQRGLFPPQLEADGGSPQEPGRESVTTPSASPRRSSTEHRAASPAQQPAQNTQPTWQELAERGDNRGAYAALSRDGGHRRLRSMDDALLAADIMRLTGHAAQAADVLQRAIREHPGDGRISVASFTLGRVLLTQLGRPRAAADAFSRARRLSPRGALAEDSLAREVEALSRAGAASAARRRAQEYIERYPEGGRIRAVRRFGGLE